MPRLSPVVAVWVLQLVVAAAAPRKTRTNGAIDGVGTFLVLTDVHLDLYYGTPLAGGRAECGATEAVSYGAAGCDSPLLLLESTVREARLVTERVAASPDFILVTGDSVRHEGSTVHGVTGVEVVRNSLKTISAVLQRHFPGTAPATDLHSHANATSNASTDAALLHVVNSIGNNDVQPNYYINASAPLDQIRPLLDSWAIPEPEKVHFGTGGYFSSRVTPTLTVISLNTIWYSRTHHGLADFAELGQDPKGQFTWLRATLARLRAEGSMSKAYIIGHIPPTLDSYARESQWDADGGYAETYRQIVADAADVIEGQLFAHVHSDEWRTHPSWRYMEPQVDWI